MTASCRGMTRSLAATHEVSEISVKLLYRRKHFML